jgi:fermentation-respiration switch protein FrsA (DUF1100 family)
MAKNLWLVGLVTSLLVGCSSLYYYPSKRELVYRHKLPIQPVDVSFDSEDGTNLHAWHFRTLDLKDPKAVIVHFHGNAENLTSHFLALYEAPAKGYAYLTFDYRGYGRSDGNPNPTGLVNDGVAAIKWMHKMYPTRPLVVFGQSLGGAVAIRSVVKIKNEVPISLLVLDSTFPDYRIAARSAFANSVLLFLFQPLAWAIVDNSESPWSDIPKISPTPLIVVHGTDDKIVDTSLGRQVFDLAKEPKEFWSIPKGKHLEFMFKNDGEFGERFYDRLAALAQKKAQN